jgi:(R,R)-butanediol dehydrogenase/meso-butanediol dehydrogenase/diacetyl reductase
VRAAVFQGPGRELVIEQVADPTPGHRQVVVRVHSCGVCGTDLSMSSGHGLLQFQPGDIPGHEHAGEVVAAGQGIERLVVGDRISPLAIWTCCGRCDNCRRGYQRWCIGTDKVVGSGRGFAEYALVGEPQAVKLAEGLSWEEGALVEPLACGLHAIDLSRLEPGSCVAVIGAGPIALSAVYWAHQRGAQRIVVTAPSDRRERFARLLGATDFVAGQDPAAEVIELAGGPPPLVVEAAGVPGTLSLALELVAPRGTVTVLGCCTEPETFLPVRALTKEVRIQYSFTYGSGDFETVMRALVSDPGGPTNMVTGRVPLDELPRAFENLRGRSPDCKVLVSLSEP